MKIKKEIRIPSYNITEELINSISHGIGAIFSIFGFIMLIIKSLNHSNLAVMTATIFGTTMVLLYTISCIYHALPPKVKGKQILRVLDHCNVYLLVFGTIIPVALIGISSIPGWVFFSIVAFVTILGIIASIIDVDMSQVLEVVCHLVNGWSVLFFTKYLITNIGMIGFILIILGGIMYSIGAVLYGIGTKKKYMHSVFHFFCLIGTLFHYLAIYLYVL